ncbi:hypothetical protein ACFQRK_03285 [Parapedobacter sp. GCM10030251]|uniref:THUMP-like domain-containing protein n=1 Tax=Parapedobacter sp. GCM10030251 TaxID=3273419 RepID=UPI003616D734
MNPHILTPEVQRYLHEHEAVPPSDIAMQRSPFADVSSLELAQQLDARKRCRKKLPLWYKTPYIYYPEKVSIEQASSEATADYKAALIPPAQRVIDLTGGMGVDAFFFARTAKMVVHCETNQALSRIAQHNAAQLEATQMQFIATDGLTYLTSQADDAFDYLYVDPSRRLGQRKVFRLEDCEPDVVGVQDELLQKAEKNLIKCAPLLDISAAVERLRKVSEVHIVSVDNECKELLLVRSRTFDGIPRVVVAALQGGRTETLTFDITAEKTAVAELGDPERYLYEPDASLLKSGAFKWISQHYGIRKLGTHTHLYTSSQRIANFMGKMFCIDKVVQYADFKKSKLPVQASVTARNFPLKVEALRRRHRIRDGGDGHLFFCAGMGGRLLVIFTSKC